MKSYISKFKFYILAFVAVFAVCGGYLSANFGVAKADASSTPVTTEFFSPNTAMEYYSLNLPGDAILWENNAVIVQDNLLHVYHDGGYSSKSFPSLKQVKRNQNMVIVSNDAVLYSLDVASLTATQLVNGTTTPSSPVGATWFDVNDEYLVTSFGSNVTIYTLNGNSIADTRSLNNKIDDSTVICINGENEIFYIKLNKIHKYDIETSSDTEITSASPSSMAVLGEYLYYSNGTEVFRVKTDGSEDAVQLTVLESEFDLGKLVNPTSVSVNDGKLIVTDKALNAVQEFEVDESSDTPALKFTGFAIAKGKTAYNRLENTVSILEKYGDNILAVDGNYLTVIRNGKYEKIKKDGDGKISDVQVKIASIGEKSAVISDGSFVKISVVSDFEGIDFKTVVIDDFSNASVFTDVYYQSGKYYAVAFKDDGVTKEKIVYGISEKGETEKLFTQPANSENLLVTADVFGNVYISDGGTVTLNYLTDGNYTQTELAVQPSWTSPSDVAVDLKGALYAIENGVVYEYNGESTVTYDIKNSALSAPTARAFAFDVIDGNVYFIFNGEEIITRCTLSNLLSFDGVDKTAPQVFEPLPYIAGYCFKDTVDTAYVTTNVNLYFLPKITPAIEENSLVNEFAYTYIDNGTKPIRLSAGTKIHPNKKILLDGMEFYRITYNFNETDYEGYVPISFTTTELSEYSEPKPYTLANVTATKVFATNNLSGTEITTLEENQQVRIYSVDDGVAKIEYLDGNDWKEGFISEDAVIETPNTVIRNALIIVAVALSVCGSAIIFILKKKS